MSDEPGNGHGLQEYFETLYEAVRIAKEEGISKEEFLRLMKEAFEKTEESN